MYTLSLNTSDLEGFLALLLNIIDIFELYYGFEFMAYRLMDCTSLFGRKLLRKKMGNGDKT